MVGRISNLRSDPALPQILRHQAIFQIGEPRAFLKMTLWQEHIPQAQLLGLCLQVINDGRVGTPPLGALAQLRVEDRIGGDAFLLDESLNLFV